MPSPVDLKHLARLARLEVSPEEAARLEADCRRILEMAAAIQALPTQGVAPLTHAMESVAPLRNDVPAPGLPRDAALEGAPSVSGEGGFFLVPKMKD